MSWARILHTSISKIKQNMLLSPAETEVTSVAEPVFPLRDTAVA